MKAQATAKLRHLRMTPRKVRLVIDLIRGMKVAEAMVQLDRLHKDAVRPVKKLLESGIANAKNNHNIKEETLVITSAFVDSGPTLHRWMPRAMGRASAIRKRTSHITLVLEGEVEEKKKAKKKNEKKAEVKKEIIKKKKSKVEEKEVKSKKEEK